MATLRSLIPYSCLPLLLIACQGSEGPPIDRSSYASLFEARDLDLLVALDQIEDDQQWAAAPWLLWIQQSQLRNLPERSRAAAALTFLGFHEGQEFCLGILGAWLPGHEETSRKHGIPRSERMAFAREIALQALRDRLAVQGRSTPPYDVNQGAPQMARAVAAIQKLLSELPTPRPDLTAPELARLYPETQPREWTRTQETWSQLRASLLREPR